MIMFALFASLLLPSQTEISRVLVPADRTREVLPPGVVHRRSMQELERMLERYRASEDRAHPSVPKRGVIEGRLDLTKHILAGSASWDFAPSASEQLLLSPWNLTISDLKRNGVAGPWGLNTQGDLLVNASGKAEQSVDVRWSLPLEQRGDLWVGVLQIPATALNTIRLSIPSTISILHAPEFASKRMPDPKDQSRQLVEITCGGSAQIPLAFAHAPTASSSTVWVNIDRQFELEAGVVREQSTLDILQPTGSESGSALPTNSTTVEVNSPLPTTSASTERNLMQQSIQLIEPANTTGGWRCESAIDWRTEQVASNRYTKATLARARTSTSLVKQANHPHNPRAGWTIPPLRLNQSAIGIETIRINIRSPMYPTQLAFHEFRVQRMLAVNNDVELTLQRPIAFVTTNEPIDPPQLARGLPELTLGMYSAGIGRSIEYSVDLSNRPRMALRMTRLANAGPLNSFQFNMSGSWRINRMLDVDNRRTIRWELSEVSGATHQQVAVRIDPPVPPGERINLDVRTVMNENSPNQLDKDLVMKLPTFDDGPVVSKLNLWLAPQQRLLEPVQAMPMTKAFPDDTQERTGLTQSGFGLNQVVVGKRSTETKSDAQCESTLVAIDDGKRWRLLASYQIEQAGATADRLLLTRVPEIWRHAIWQYLEDGRWQNVQPLEQPNEQMLLVFENGRTRRELRAVAQYSGTDLQLAPVLLGAIAQRCECQVMGHNPVPPAIHATGFDPASKPRVDLNQLGRLHAILHANKVDANTLVQLRRQASGQPRDVLASTNRSTSDLTREPTSLEAGDARRSITLMNDGRVVAAEPLGWFWHCMPINPTLPVGQAKLRVQLPSDWLPITSDWHERESLHDVQSLLLSVRGLDADLASQARSIIRNQRGDSKSALEIIQQIAQALSAGNRLVLAPRSLPIWLQQRSAASTKPPAIASFRLAQQVKSTRLPTSQSAASASASDILVDFLTEHRLEMVGHGGLCLIRPTNQVDDVDTPKSTRAPTVVEQSSWRSLKQQLLAGVRTPAWAEISEVLSNPSSPLVLADLPDTSAAISTQTVWQSSSTPTSIVVVSLFWRRLVLFFGVILGVLVTRRAHRQLIVVSLELMLILLIIQTFGQLTRADLTIGLCLGTVLGWFGHRWLALNLPRWRDWLQTQFISRTPATTLALLLACVVCPQAMGQDKPATEKRQESDSLEARHNRVVIPFDPTQPRQPLDQVLIPDQLLRRLESDSFEQSHPLLVQQLDLEGALKPRNRVDWKAKVTAIADTRNTYPIRQTLSFGQAIVSAVRINGRPADFRVLPGSVSIDIPAPGVITMELDLESAVVGDAIRQSVSLAIPRAANGVGRIKLTDTCLPDPSSEKQVTQRANEPTVKPNASDQAKELVLERTLANTQLTSFSWLLRPLTPASQVRCQSAHWVELDPMSLQVTSILTIEPTNSLDVDTSAGLPHHVSLACPSNVVIADVRSADLARWWLDAHRAELHLQFNKPAPTRTIQIRSRQVVEVDPVGNRLSAKLHLPTPTAGKVDQQLIALRKLPGWNVSCDATVDPAISAEQFARNWQRGQASSNPTLDANLIANIFVQTNTNALRIGAEQAEPERSVDQQINAKFDPESKTWLHTYTITQRSGLAGVQQFSFDLPEHVALQQVTANPGSVVLTKQRRITVLALLPIQNELTVRVLARQLSLPTAKVGKQSKTESDERTITIEPCSCQASSMAIGWQIDQPELHEATLTFSNPAVEVTPFDGQWTASTSNPTVAAVVRYQPESTAADVRRISVASLSDGRWRIDGKIDLTPMRGGSYAGTITFEQPFGPVIWSNAEGVQPELISQSKQEFVYRVPRLFVAQTLEWSMVSDALPALRPGTKTTVAVPRIKISDVRRADEIFFVEPSPDSSTSLKLLPTGAIQPTNVTASTIRWPTRWEQQSMLRSLTGWLASSVDWSGRLELEFAPLEPADLLSQIVELNMTHHGDGLGFCEWQLGSRRQAVSLQTPTGISIKRVVINGEDWNPPSNDFNLPLPLASNRSLDLIQVEYLADGSMKHTEPWPSLSPIRPSKEFKGLLRIDQQTGNRNTKTWQLQVPVNRIITAGQWQREQASQLLERIDGLVSQPGVSVRDSSLGSHYLLPRLRMLQQQLRTSQTLSTMSPAQLTELTGTISRLQSAVKPKTARKQVEPTIIQNLPMPIHLTRTSDSLDLYMHRTPSTDANLTSADEAPARIFADWQPGDRITWHAPEQPLTWQQFYQVIPIALLLIVGWQRYRTRN